MPKYVGVLPLVPLQAGDGFRRADWPLHVTVLGNFSSPESSAEVIGRLAVVLADTPPIAAIVGSGALFGPGADIPVALLTNPAPATALHERLADALEGTAQPELPEYWRSGFRPHVTATRHGRAEPGDRIRLAQFALVDMNHRGDVESCAVLAVRQLGG